MLRIHDGRNKNERMLKDIEVGSFFYKSDCLCRRVNFDIDLHYDGDEILIVEMPSGKLNGLPLDTWVEPIPDNKIWLEIED